MTQDPSTQTKITYQPDRLPKVICDEHPEWVDIYELAMRTAFNNIEYPAQPNWLPQLTCMPGQGYIWQWDSCFMTLYARYSNGLLPGMNNLDNLYRLQRDDGYISMAYDMNTNEEAYGERVNPPLYAWVEWEYFLATGDDARFAHILPILVKFFDWMKANRRRESCDLYWFEDSGSSGMDNSPRSGYIAAHLDGSDICHIDLACQQALTAKYLAEISGHLGKAELADRFRVEHRDLAQLINERHWCDRTGFYYDLFARAAREHRMNFVNHKTAASFWPILSDVADGEQVDCLIEHLLDPDEFWTLHPVPTLSRDDPNYDPTGGYWLGGVWAPTNYMIVKGLERKNRYGLARQVAVKHLEAMVAVAQDENFGSIWEAYAPEYYLPSTEKTYGQIARPNFVGWSGLGPIAMLIEQILGFRLNAVQNQVTWNISTPGQHGVENLLFNGKTLSLTCDGYHADGEKTSIAVTTTGTLTLAISLMYNREKTFELAAGEHVLKM